MKWRPLSMTSGNAAKVRAGLKTQTRRVIAGVDVAAGGPIHAIGWFAREPGFQSPCQSPIPLLPPGNCQGRFARVPSSEHGFHYHTVGGHWWGYLPCPYGEPGDRFWLREPIRRGSGGVAEYDDGSPVLVDGDRMLPWRWKVPRLGSRYSPRVAARSFVELVAVRVERVRDISEADAVAEGCEADGLGRFLAVDHFAHLWDTLNGERAPWSDNPWVWRLTIRHMEAP